MHELLNDLFGERNIQRVNADFRLKCKSLCTDISYIYLNHARGVQHKHSLVAQSGDQTRIVDGCWDT